MWVISAAVNTTDTCSEANPAMLEITSVALGSLMAS